MKEYKGFIRFVREMEGTKSEGDYAYLELDENTKYRLYRSKHLAADSDFLRPYEDMEVCVKGDVEENESRCITSINNQEV